MGQQYPGADDTVKAKIARVLVQKRSSYLTSYPLKIADIISISSYDPKVAHGWQDVGLTIQPTTESEAFDKTDIETQQHGKIRSRKGDYTRTLAFAPAEQTRLSRQLAKAGTGYNDNAVLKERRMWFTNYKRETIWRAAVINFDDETGKIDVTIFPFIKRAGDASERAWDKGAGQDYPITYDVFVDPQIIDSETGEKVAVYDIWQY